MRWKLIAQFGKLLHNLKAYACFLKQLLICIKGCMDINETLKGKVLIMINYRAKF